MMTTKTRDSRPPLSRKKYAADRTTSKEIDDESKNRMENKKDMWTRKDRRESKQKIAK